MSVKIKYDLMLMKYMALFESRTRVRLKDAFEDGNGLLHFVVDKGFGSKAIGKNGETVKKLSMQIGRKIKIVEFDPVRETFIKRLIFPLKVEEITFAGDLVTIKDPSVETKSKIIGRNAVNLRNYENIVKRYFPLDEIKVV